MRYLVTSYPRLCVVVIVVVFLACLSANTAPTEPHLSARSSLVSMHLNIKILASAAASRWETGHVFAVPGGAGGGSFQSAFRSEAERYPDRTSPYPPKELVKTCRRSVSLFLGNFVGWDWSTLIHVAAPLPRGSHGAGSPRRPYGWLAHTCSTSHEGHRDHAQ